MSKLPLRLLMNAIRLGSPGKLACAAPATTARARAIPHASAGFEKSKRRMLSLLCVDDAILRPGRQRSVAIEGKGREIGLVVLEFRLRGPVEVFADSVSLDLGGTKQRAVLALLLLHANELLLRERLIDDLRGGDPPATARDTVKVYVGR